MAMSSYSLRKAAVEKFNSENGTLKPFGELVRLLGETDFDQSQRICRRLLGKGREKE